MFGDSLGPAFKKTPDTARCSLHGLQAGHIGAFTFEEFDQFSTPIRWMPHLMGSKSAAPLTFFFAAQLLASQNIQPLGTSALDGAHASCSMNPFKVAFTFFGLAYAVIAIYGIVVASSAALVGVAGLLWCSAGWWLSNRYLEV